MLKPDDHVLEYVDAFLHDALGSGEARLVERHCEACPICRVALEEAKKRADVLQSLPVIEASEALIQSTQRRIEQVDRARSKWRRRFLATAAIAASLLGIVHLYYYNLKAGPYDLRILGQSGLLADSEASLRILFCDPRTGAPYPGAPVEVDLIDAASRAITHLASFTTDALGTGAIRMKMPDWAPGQYELQVRAKHGLSEETISKTVQLRRSWRLLLTSDKPVYKPGDVIHVRSLSLAQPTHKPVAGQTISFSIVDPKGNVILRKRDVTSRFGISAIDCPLATEIIEGQYQIRCELGDTTSALAVTVEKYVLPKFKIDVQLDQPYYEPGQKLRGTIAARYFFGRPVKEGEVQIEVRETGGGRIGETTAKTDADGNAKFELPLPETLVGRAEQTDEAEVTLTVTLTDSAGQKQSATATRTVSSQPIHIEAIPEAGSLILNETNRVYFLTTYPDGRPAPARVVVSGVDREIETNSLGEASLEFAPLDYEVRWLVRASDSAGKSGRREFLFRCDAFGGSFLLRTDRAVYDGGQTVQVTAIGGGAEPVFVDLVKDGQTIMTQAIAMADGRGQLAIDLPPEVFGAVRLCAYRFSRLGTPTFQNRLLYVHQANGLHIVAKLDRSEYRPGERAKLTVAVSDVAGKPVAAGISLAGVDEAVFSVLANRSGLKPISAALDDELLKPVYALDPSFDAAGSGAPAVVRNDFEQAVFAKASQQHSDRDTMLRELVRQFGDNYQQMLDVLNRPDWEQLAADMPYMEKYIPLLRTDGSTFSLRDSTYSVKAHEAELARNRALELLTLIWVVGGVVAGIAFLVWLSRTVQFLGTVVTIVVIGGVLCSLLLPAVQSARESSRRGQAMNDLRQIGLVLDASASTKSADMPALSEGRTRGEDAGGRADESSARVREWFPETLLWRPELITDENGQATLDLDLADSITTWELSATAVSADGQLGNSQSPLRVFQPFFVDLNLPVSLTRGDEVAIPAVVYNYLDKPLTVDLQLADGKWFERLGDPATKDKVKKVELAPGAVQSVSFRIRARQIGKHELTVHASAAGVADAIKRTIEISPDGRRTEQTTGGTLQRPAEINWSVPADAIDGSVRASVKIYPSTFSQLVDGLEGIFQRPYGCFEQTSSTTYPNVLALDYLRRTKKSVPEVEARAREYVTLGYQRLLSFEISGGGFDWFGNPPAHRILTAYGLMEFADMARVTDVDPRLIERTRRWLLDQQNADGSWTPEGHLLHEDPTRSGGELEQLCSTAYNAWAVFGGDGGDRFGAGNALNYLLRHEPDTIDDPYVLALVAIAVAALDADSRAVEPYLRRLEAMVSRSTDGKLAWWEQSAGRRTMFYGGGRSGSVETTALAALAMIHAHADAGTIRGALAWLISQKDSSGGWHSTQATVLALKALLAGTNQPLGEARERRFDVSVEGKSVRTLVVSADQADVVQQVDLTSVCGQGSHRITVTEQTDSAAGYQATLAYHRAEQSPAVSDKSPLAIKLDYDRTSLAVDDLVKATATIENRRSTPAPMILLDLPIPPGFAVAAEDFEALQSAGAIAKFQTTPRSVIVYLRELKPAEPLALAYHLRATMPVKISAPPARVYEYYNPDHAAETAATALTVIAKE